MENEKKILIGGALSIGLLYLIPSYMGYIWAGLFLSLFGAILFLTILYKAGKREYKEADSGKTTLTFFSFLIVSSVVIFGFDYYKANVQRELLRDIKVTIDSSIIETEIRAELLEVYREYLLQNQDEGTSVIDVATNYFGERLKENQKFQGKTTELEDDLNFVYHKDTESDNFTIYSTAPYSQSWDDDFENRNGSVGLFQTKTTLTEMGVTHERQN